MFESPENITKLQGSTKFVVDVRGFGSVARVKRKVDLQFHQAMTVVHAGIVSRWRITAAR